MKNIKTFITPNKDLIFKFSKQKNTFNFSPFSNYICSILIKNNLNVPLFEIKGNEKEFVNLLEFLLSFCFIDEVGTDVMYFSPNSFMNSIYINCFDYCSGLIDYNDYSIEIGERNHLLQNNICRVRFSLDQYSFDGFLYHIYELLEDIDYLDQLFVNVGLLEYFLDL